jgi:hypothetical protein
MSGEVTIKQDKATGKVNLIQEFDKEAEGQASKPKESKSKQNRKGKGNPVASSPQQLRNNSLNKERR